MKTLQNIKAKLNAFDEKHTNFHSLTYWLLFLTGAAEVAMIETQNIILNIF